MAGGRPASRVFAGCILPMLVALAGCANRAGDAPSPDDLVRYRPPPPGLEVIHLTGSTTGRLVHRDGCFRIANHRQAGGGTMLIWPHDYVAVMRNGRHGVMDSEGRTAFDGDWITVGGGSGDGLPEHVVHRERAAACGGPYASAWLPF